jgi:hypothetical protein
MHEAASSCQHLDAAYLDGAGSEPTIAWLEPVA